MLMMILVVSQCNFTVITLFCSLFLNRFYLEQIKHLFSSKNLRTFCASQSIFHVSTLDSRVHGCMPASSQTLNPPIFAQLRRVTMYSKQLHSLTTMQLVHVHSRNVLRKHHHNGHFEKFAGITVFDTEATSLNCCWSRRHIMPQSATSSVSGELHRCL